MWTYLSQTSAEKPPKNDGVRKAAYWLIWQIWLPLLLLLPFTGLVHKWLVNQIYQTHLIA
jgi:hypothetical protein